MILGDPSPGAWNKVQQYASWMRELHLDLLSALADDTILKLRLNSPAGGWFPALQELDWWITESNVRCADLCFSPHLRKVSIHVPWSWSNSRVPHDILPVAASISALPTSALQSISVEFDSRREVHWADFKDAFSSAVLRCGPSLTKFTSPIPLSDAAINHLIQLPHLRTWRVDHPPPKYSASSLPIVFPSLTEFTMGKGITHEWFSLFKRLEGPVSTTQGMTPLSSVKRSLRSLRVENFPSPIINSSFTSPIQMFYNLVSLNVEVRCHDEYGGGQCGFKLNNGDVTDLAMSLPRLESLLLGRPCFENACTTTVACLLQISVYCAKLRELGIHFNTADIVEDFKGISEDPKLREVRSLPRCTLPYFGTGRAPLAFDELGLETVAKGMVDIFPSLKACHGFESTWDEVNNRISEHTRNAVCECSFKYTSLSPDTLFPNRGKPVMGTKFPPTRSRA